MGELTESVFGSIYNMFKINSVLFRTLHVGMTMVDDVEKLYIQETYDTVAHDIVQRNMILDMTPENKAAAMMVKGIVNIEKNLLTRISTNVLTLDKFGTYDRSTVVSPEVQIVIPNDFGIFSNGLLVSLGEIEKLLMSKGSLINKFSLTMLTGEAAKVTIKQDERYKRTLNYQGLTVDIEPEMFQLSINSFITNLNIKVDFYRAGSNDVINVIQVPFKVTVHNSIVKIAGMQPTKSAILVSEYEYDTTMKYLSSYYYDTVDRKIAYTVTPSTVEDPTTVSETIYKDTEKGRSTVDIEVKCINSIKLDSNIVALAHIHESTTDKSYGSCSDALSITINNETSVPTLMVTFDAAKITTVVDTLNPLYVMIDIGISTDDDVFRDSFAVKVPVDLTMTEHGEIVEVEPKTSKAKRK